MIGIPFPFNLNCFPFCVPGGILTFALPPSMVGTSIVVPSAASVKEIGNSKNKFSLDLGPFVKAIEYASGKKSILMGKPEKNFFDLVINDLNTNNENILMIGDDIIADIEGSKNAKLKAVQVKTGKFQENDHKNSIQPYKRIESIADLPKLVGL